MQRQNFFVKKKKIRLEKMTQEVKALSTYDEQHKANIVSCAVGAREIVQKLKASAAFFRGPRFS